MPNKDGTGPQGKGPKTGRQMGNCKDAKPNESESDGRPARGLGIGAGRRPRGFGKQRNQQNA